MSLSEIAFGRLKGERMALLNCPECGAQVSSKAPACPSCGNPIAMESGPVGGFGPGVTTRPDFWHDPNSGALGCLAITLVLGACATLSMCTRG